MVNARSYSPRSVQSAASRGREQEEQRTEPHPHSHCFTTILVTATADFDVLAVDDLASRTMRIRSCRREAQPAGPAAGRLAVHQHGGIVDGTIELDVPKLTAPGAPAGRGGGSPEAPALRGSERLPTSLTAVVQFALAPMATTSTWNGSGASGAEPARQPPRPASGAAGVANGRRRRGSDRSVPRGAGCVAPPRAPIKHGLCRRLKLLHQRPNSTRALHVPLRHPGPDAEPDAGEHLFIGGGPEFRLSAPVEPRDTARVLSMASACGSTPSFRGPDGLQHATARQRSVSK